MPMQAHLTALLLVRNEAERYLRRVTDQLSRIVDAFVVVDDASTDDTPYVVASYPKVRILQRNTIPGFDDEYALRRLVWDLAVGTGPDWLLTLDADEVFEDRAEAEIPRLLRRSDIDYYSFRLYDFWGSETHYRVDGPWKAHERYEPYLIRYDPGFPYRWVARPIHCRRFPANVLEQRGARSSLRIKHYGWAGGADERAAKYRFYMSRDPDGRYGDLAQYASILDPAPELREWRESEWGENP